ncbi:MAG: hypothetical protein Q4F41_10735 [Eubacteriales bacterium]|nr:hypothetical protein [Eubacteriales bacterium]
MKKKQNTAFFAFLLSASSCYTAALPCLTAFAETAQITDQSFDVELDEWGAVTFASFLPEDEDNADVSFKLQKDGSVVYEFPGVTEENTRPGQEFVQVSAVSFQDYNADARTDILLLIEYASQDTPDERFTEVRLYTQPSGSQEFALDSGLSEYLTENGYNDYIANVMNGIAEYRQTYSETELAASAERELTEEEMQQLQLIAENIDLWIDQETYSAAWQYAVTDLDQNERLEVIASSMQGTGLFTYSTYFEVNETFDGLKAVERSLAEGESEADILVQTVPVYYDAATGLYSYVYEDLIRNGYAENYENKWALTLSDGQLQETTLAFCSTIYQDETPTITYQNADGEEISEEAYEAIADTVFADLEKKTASFTWLSPEDSSEWTALDGTSLAELLADSYRGFSIQ